MTIYNRTQVLVVPSRFWDHKWALALAAPVLLALSFPPFNTSILQIPAFVLLFRLATLCNDKRQVIYYTYPSFVLWNFFSTHWLMMATVAGGLAAILANAALMLIPLLLIRFVFNSPIRPVFASLVAACTWVSYEFLHHNWDLAWPWLTLGNGWANLTGAIQYISFTGVFGISFWVILTASLFYIWLEKQTRQFLSLAVFIFFLGPLLSVLSLITLNQHHGEPVEVVIVQPDSDSYQQFGGLPSLDALLDKLLAMSDDARTDQTDLIIWPENAIDSSLSITSPYFGLMRDSLAAWNTRLITGTGLVEFYDDDNRPAVARSSGTGQYYNIFNAALHLGPDGEEDIYRKGKLVPVVERLPFVDFFQRLDRFGWMDWGDHAGYGTGKTADIFNINAAKTPALICYDSVFPGWVRQFVDGGASFLTIITNDGWWGHSHGHIQHFAYARLRAIEHRMWIARSANNGISGIISPDGRVQKKTNYRTEAAFSYTIYTNNHPTFYSRFGNWMGYVSVVVSLLGLAVITWGHRRRKESFS